MIVDRDGRRRVVIDSVRPQVDEGRFAIKRSLGETVAVRADVFADGHDRIRVELLYRGPGQESWTVQPMTHRVNDEWVAGFAVTQLGDYLYTVRGWVDPFATWQASLARRAETNQDVAVELRIGIEMLRAMAKRAGRSDAEAIKKQIRRLRSARQVCTAVRIALSDELTALVARYPDRSLASVYDKELAVIVDRPKAVFSAWYELFPRSFGRGGRHGTFRDCERLLPEIAQMGFDVLYLPPIHPIGQTHRKGRNNATTCTSADPGCPWAIGSAEGGHTAVAGELGTLSSFRRLVEKAGEHGLEIAMDLAFQCSPDHPYVQSHPEWFRRRPDGTVQFAENPPKRYEDIIPLDFETPHWRTLWEELRDVVLFWIDQGVRIFRADNPHTKPFGFWQWLIDEVRRRHPDVLFLAEAFTRPKVMQRLAKVGFNQSYTYFAWRNTKWELEHYIRELTQTEVAEYMRPNFWPNTPDILPQYLQYGGRAAFIIRLVLAATLSSSYGIYGPAFELCVTEAIEGAEEYLDSEKYEIRRWDWNREGNIREVVARLNRIRRANPSLQRFRNIRLYEVRNENLLCYGKTGDEAGDVTVVIVNLDPHHTQSGRVQLPLDTLGLDPHQSYLMDDALTGNTYVWQGPSNHIELDPDVMPACILHLRRALRREIDVEPSV